MNAPLKPRRVEKKRENISGCEFAPSASAAPRRRRRENKWKNNRSRIRISGQLTPCGTARRATKLMRHAPAVEDITGDVIDPRQSAAMESIHLCSFVKIRSCFRERERERERESLEHHAKANEHASLRAS